MPEVTALADLASTPHAEVFDRGTPRTVRLSLDAGDRIPAHTHPETSIVLHLLEGHLELTLGTDEYSVTAGELVRFSGDQEISPYALEASTAILVFT